MTVWFDERAAKGADATSHLRDRVPPPGAPARPRMPAAATSFAGATEPRPRDACIGLASAALAEGRLLEADNGFLFVPPVGVLAFAERPEATTNLEEGPAHALQLESLFYITFRRGLPSAIAAA